MGCNFSNTPPDAGAPGGGLVIGIDSAEHRSGNNSLKVIGAAEGCGVYAINTTAFSSVGPQVYVRFYARFSGLSGSTSGMATPSHCGFLSMYSGSPANTDPNFWQDYNNGPTSGVGGQIRLGSQSSVLDWNNIVMHADATLPDLGPPGIAQSIDPPVNQWECFEFHLDQTTGHIEFWYNGTAVPGLSWDGTSMSGVSDQWATQGPPVPLSLQSFGLGWLGLNGAETAWYDDVAFASCRIGCQ